MIHKKKTMITLEINVPIPAPTIPSFGNPKDPKINR